VGSCVGVYKINHIRKNIQVGHSLLEVTISLAIASILILGGFQWFQIVKKEYLQRKVQIAEVNTQRNLYLYLSQDIQMSKYLGSRAKDRCFPIMHHLIDEHILYQYNLLPNPHSHAQNQNRSQNMFYYKNVSGFTAPFACVNALPDLLCRRLAPESDVLIIHMIGKQIKQLKAALVASHDTIETEEKHHFYKGSLVLIADTLQGDLFIANDVSGHRVYHQQTSSGNQTAHFSKCYQKSAEIIELQNVAYYLSGSVLYRDDFLHPAQEIITDIELFKVEYGLMKQSKIQFKKGSEINDEEWKFIQSVRLKIRATHSKTDFEFEFTIPNRYSATDRAHLGHLNITLC
jgi:hypothetical protein